MIDRSTELADGFASLAASLSATRRRYSSGPDGRGRGGSDGPTVGAAVPATLVTGFLGSGKTTVLRRLLTGRHGIAVTVIVNDLAAVNIDAETLGRSAGNDPDRPSEIARLELSNGCACCELTDDLVASLEAAIGNDGEPGPPASPAPEAIVIEASGAADPVTMAAAIDATPGVHLDGVVCVADAEALPHQLAEPPLDRLARRQLEAAHLVLLSKVDLVPPHEAREVTESIGSIAPGRQVIPCPRGEIDPVILLGAAARGAALPTTGSSPRRPLATRSCPLGPVDLRSLGAWLEGDHGLLRAKGWVADHAGKTFALQVVGRRWSLTEAVEEHDAIVVTIATTDDAVDAAVSALRLLAS